MLLHPFFPVRIDYLTFSSTVELGFQPSRIAVVDTVSPPWARNGLLYNNQREDLESRYAMEAPVVGQRIETSEDFPWRRDFWKEMIGGVYN